MILTADLSLIEASSFASVHLHCFLGPQCYSPISLNLLLYQEVLGTRGSGIAPIMIIKENVRLRPEDVVKSGASSLTQRRKAHCARGIYQLPLRPVSRNTFIEGTLKEGPRSETLTIV